MEKVFNESEKDRGGKWYIFKVRTHGLYGVQPVYTENGKYYRKGKDGNYTEIRPLRYFGGVIHAFETAI